MKRFKSISVSEATFDEVVHLTKILLPGVTLSKAQTIETLVKNLEVETFKQHIALLKLEAEEKRL
jgi:hypothetical protein|tara:strand:- start:1410 stop:1604 length:195 start_codon:yes stop_codon:yes gene_type:complete